MLRLWITFVFLFVAMFVFCLLPESAMAQSRGVRSYVVRSGNSYVRKYASTNRATRQSAPRHQITRPKQYQLGHGSRSSQTAVATQANAATGTVSNESTEVVEAEVTVSPSKQTRVNAPAYSTPIQTTPIQNYQPARRSTPSRRGVRRSNRRC